MGDNARRIRSTSAADVLGPWRSACIFTQENKTDDHTAGLQQNKTAPPATSDRSVDDFFVIAYQIYALVLGLLIAYLISTAA